MTKSKLTETEKKEIIQNVYEDLKSRSIHPSGTFDKAGRFYAEHSDLISVRSPSRAWPYSEMTACRTKRYVKKVFDKYQPKSQKELESLV